MAGSEEIDRTPEDLKAGVLKSSAVPAEVEFAFVQPELVSIGSRLVVPGR
jgi:hypothetical protein